ncbi:MAG: S-methyl-5-thioribose-1-phosphate isomerase [Candidatus Humimicrobiaceae bacterium]
MKNKSKVRTLKWEDGKLLLIDQRKLPFIKDYAVCDSYEKVGIAIKDMIVRGAPAIGVSAAYGVALAANTYEGSSKADFKKYFEDALLCLAASRPTAVNLFWALKRMKDVFIENEKSDITSLKKVLMNEAQKIESEDVLINRKIGDYGIEAFKDFKGRLKILTHCNAGALATAGYGTALGVIRSLYSIGKIDNVIVDETRPYLQGARLTAWELEEEHIPFFIITDNMAAHMMSEGEVDAVVVGADRIASNGDSANKIGTLGVSILASYFRIPFFVAAPLSTIDMNIKSGREIPIEERSGKEVREILGQKIISESMKVRNPSFDVTPYKNITGIITEKGVIYPPFTKNIRKLF